MCIVLLVIWFGTGFSSSSVLVMTLDLLPGRGGGGGGHSHMKGAEKLVVSLRGVNFGFWSLLGCSGQNAIILVVKVSFRVAREEAIFNTYVFKFVLLYSIHIIKVFYGPPLGVKKKIGPRPDRSPLGV